MRKIALMSVCLLFLVFALGFMGPILTVSAVPAETGTGTNETGGSGQIVPPVDPGMSDVVAFDISKGQWTDDAPDFIQDLQAAGFTVATIDISQGIPSNVMKIIVMGLQGNLHITSPYTAGEGTTLANWVSNGGELMILGEWGEFSYDTEELIKVFGVTPQYNQVTDPTDYDTLTYWVIYQSDNFAPHPILAGVTATEHLSGESFEAPPGTIITADADATPSNAPVAVALDWGNGRVAMFGDTNWVQKFGGNGYSKVDNAQVAMQTIYWLNEPPPPVPESGFNISILFSISLVLYMFLGHRMRRVKK